MHGAHHAKVSSVFPDEFRFHLDSSPEARVKIQYRVSTEPEKVSTPDLSASKVRGAVKTGRVAEILEQFHALSPVRKAELFVQLDLDDQKAFLSQAPPPLVASILADCDSASLEELLIQTDPASMASALRQIPPDALADIVLRLPSEQADKILGTVDSTLREDVRKLMTFHPRTAGGLMTTRYLSVPDVVTVERALQIIRGGGRADTPSYIYIVDANEIGRASCRERV